MKERTNHMKHTALLMLLTAAILLTACQPDIGNETKSVPPETLPTEIEQEFEVPVDPAEETILAETPIVEEAVIVEETPILVQEIEFMGPEDAPEVARLMTKLGVEMPRTDGSTSTLPMDIAVHAALLETTEEELSWVAHTKTYTSLQNLRDGLVDVLFRTPLAANERETMAAEGFDFEEEPVAGEGFVFVVNADNPVDSLTSDQLRDIYAGRITNWSEVGGEDLPIIAYQRNADSGSQNYMIAFMGATPLMKPVTDQLPASMSGLMNAVANYENSRGAIGYSVYSYSDGMYEDSMKIKHLAVDGVEPSFENMANGTYPLLGYNYAVFSADLPADSPVRTVVKWIQSDAGQKVIAAAGYVPYRHMDGLTLPEMVPPKLYTATGTGGPAGETDYDYWTAFYPVTELPTFADPDVEKVIRDYINGEQARIDAITEAEVDTFLSGRRSEYPGWTRNITLQLVNGYLSVLSGIEYMYGYQDSPTYYYKPAGAVFDVYTGERLAFSDLWPEGSDFVPALNAYLAKEATAPYGTFGSRHPMIHEFTGLEEDQFVWIIDQIVFLPGHVFTEGVALSLDGIHEEMSVSAPRDMSGIFQNTDRAIYKILRQQWHQAIGRAEQFPASNRDRDQLTVWYLDENKSPLSPAVTEKVNGFIRNLYDTYFTMDAVTARLEEEGYPIDTLQYYSTGPYADFSLGLYGNRYVYISMPNEIHFERKDEYKEEEHEFLGISLTGSAYNEYGYWTHHYLSALTGETVTLPELFTDGWETEALVYPEIYEVYTEVPPESLGTYAEVLGGKEVRVAEIYHYDQADRHNGTVQDLERPAVVTVISGDEVYNVRIPRQFIR